jgi:hypothetical protein
VGARRVPLLSAALRRIAAVDRAACIIFALPAPSLSGGVKGLLMSLIYTEDMGFGQMIPIPKSTCFSVNLCTIVQGSTKG